MSVCPAIFRISNLKYFSNLFPPGHHHLKTTHGGEEFGYVLSGDLTLVIEDQEYLLGPGYSFHFVAERPHTHYTPAGRKSSYIVSTQKFLTNVGGE